MIVFLFLLVVLGVLVYVVESSIPMPPPFKVAIRVTVILFLAWYLLALVGYAPDFPARRVP